MDGVAYAGTDEPNAPETVTLNYGTATDNTELQVTLRRAAAKIVVRIQKGDRVTSMTVRKPIMQDIICATCLIQHR